MWTGFLKVWEAMDGPLVGVAIALLAYAAGLLRSAWQELRDVKARATEDRAEFKAQLDRQRDEANARADRERDESRARSKEDRALYMRENAHLYNAIAEQSKQIAEQSKQIAEQSKQIAALSKAVSALQGDVEVLLDRSARSSGGKGGTGHPAAGYEIAHQAVPTPREEEDGEDERR